MTPTSNKFKHTCELFNSRELAALSLTAKAYRNGAVHVFGSYENLERLLDLCLPRGVSLSIWARKPEEAGYPRIELHPCHRDRIDLGLIVTGPVS